MPKALFYFRLLQIGQQSTVEAPSLPLENPRFESLQRKCSVAMCGQLGIEEAVLLPVKPRQVQMPLLSYSKPTIFSKPENGIPWEVECRVVGLKTGSGNFNCICINNYLLKLWCILYLIIWEMCYFSKPPAVKCLTR